MAIRKEKRNGVHTGKWIATWKDENGKWRPKTFASQREAKLFLARVEDEQRNNGGYVDHRDALPFAVVADKFIDAQERRVRVGELTAGSLREQRIHVRHLCNMIGGMRVTEMNYGYVRNTLRPDLKVGRAEKTAANIFTTFKQIMRFSAECGYVARDPVAGIKIEVKRRKVTSAQRISKQVARELVAAVDVKDRLILKFAMRTGLRAGEQAALTWDDLTFDADRVKVSVNKARKKNGAVDTPKTSAGNRSIVLGCDLVADLRAWKLAQPVEERRNGLVFPTRTGAMETSTDNWRNRILIPACKAIGVDPIRWHDLRHIFASVLVYDLDLPWTQVGLLMGHRSIQFTIDTYGHWREDEERDNQTAELMAAAW